MIEVKLVGVEIAVTDLDDIPGGKAIIFRDPSGIQYVVPMGPNSCKTLAANLTAPKGITIPAQTIQVPNGKKNAH